MLSIREANIDDAIQIGKVHVDSWRTGYKSFMPKSVLNNLSYDERISFWKSTFNSNSSYKRVYCAVHDSKIIGFAHFDLAPNKHPEYKGELKDMHILPEYRGEGIGRNLFYKGVNYFITKNVNSLILWVFSANPYRKFYERMGGKIAYRKNWLFFGLNLHNFDTLPLVSVKLSAST